MILEVGRAVELDLQHVRGQQFSLDDVQLHVLGAQADDLVERVNDRRPNEEQPESV